MLEKLSQLVKENAGDAIVNNNAIPNEKNEEAITAASSSIMDALKQQMSSGDLSQMLNAFKGGSPEGNSLTEQASAGFVNKLSGMGINVDSAKALAVSIIPGIIGKFFNKTNDPNDNSFDLKDILSNISGPDGKFQISDLTDMLGGNKTDADRKPGEEGGLMDKLKGLF